MGAARARRRGARSEEGCAPPPQRPPRAAPRADAACNRAGRYAPKPDEGDLLLLQALPRPAAGRIPAAKERKQGRIPAVVFNQARTRHAHARATPIALSGDAALSPSLAQTRPQFDQDKLLITLNSHDVLRRVRAAVAARLRLQGFRACG